MNFSKNRVDAQIVDWCYENLVTIIKCVSASGECALTLFFFKERIPYINFLLDGNVYKENILSVLNSNALATSNESLVVVY